MRIKKIKTQSQRITSFGYLKKIQNQRTAVGSSYFKKTSHNCWVSRKLGKEKPGRFLADYFTFIIWDLSFRTSIDGQTRSEFQDLDRQMNRNVILYIKSLVTCICLSVCDHWTQRKVMVDAEKSDEKKKSDDGCREK
jgi:hypothetical protein